jgi:hypothetical protein
VNLNRASPNETHETNNFKFKILNNAIAFATDQTLPAIRLVCEPMLNDQKQGADLIKELIRLIEHDFNPFRPDVSIWIHKVNTLQIIDL